MTGPSSETASAPPSWREKHAAKYGDTPENRAKSAANRAKMKVSYTRDDRVVIEDQGKTYKGRVAERYRPGVDQYVSVYIDGNPNVQSFSALKVDKDDSPPAVKVDFDMPKDLKKLSTSALMIEWERRSAVWDYNNNKPQRDAGFREPVAKFTKAQRDKIDDEMSKIDEELRKRWEAGEDLEFWFPYG